MKICSECGHYTGEVCLQCQKSLPENFLAYGYGPDRNGNPGGGPFCSPECMKKDLPFNVGGMTTGRIQSSITISVYLDDGRVFEYPVSTAEKAREHAYAIVTGGYRHTVDQCLEHYPPHRILKVKASGSGIGTMYPDTVRGT